MAHQLKYVEWESVSGRWYCNDVSDLAGISGKWWIPARLMGLPLTEYINMLITTYKADVRGYNPDKDFLAVSWSPQHYAYMHKFVLMINRESKKKNWQV